MENVAVARRFVARSFADRVPSDVVDDLVLATSELVTNALEHGRAAAVVVSVRCQDGEAAVTVRSSGGQGLAFDTSTWRAAPPDRTSGRGLGIVHAVADDIDVRRTGDSIEITVHRRFPAA